MQSFSQISLCYRRIAALICLATLCLLTILPIHPVFGVSVPFQESNVPLNALPGGTGDETKEIQAIINEHKEARSGAALGEIRFNNPLSVDNLTELLTQIYAFVFGTAAALTTIAILIGAFHIMMSEGNSERRTRGKNWILYSVSGFTLLLMARSIAPLIADLLTGVTTAASLLDRVAGIAFTVLLILATFLILWAAWLYMSDSGDRKNITAAKSRILSAAIAIAIAVFARTIPALIQSLLGA